MDTPGFNFELPLDITGNLETPWGMVVVSMVDVDRVGITFLPDLLEEENPIENGFIEASLDITVTQDSFEAVVAAIRALISTHLKKDSQEGQTGQQVQKDLLERLKQLPMAAEGALHSVEFESAINAEP